MSVFFFACEWYIAYQIWEYCQFRWGCDLDTPPPFSFHFQLWILHSCLCLCRGVSNVAPSWASYKVRADNDNVFEYSQIPAVCNVLSPRSRRQSFPCRRLTCAIPNRTFSWSLLTWFRRVYMIRWYKSLYTWWRWKEITRIIYLVNLHKF